MKLLDQGYSLIELCYALAITLILIGVAAPSLHNVVQYEQMQTQVNQLVQLLNTAKVSAIKYHKAVSFCASIDHINCDPTWQGDFVLFIDEQENGLLTDKSNLLHIWQLNPKRGYFAWQASQTYLTMRPNGINTGNAGRFYYCPSNNNLNYARAIIINLVSRIRIVDKQTDQNLHCG